MINHRDRSVHAECYRHVIEAYIIHINASVQHVFTNDGAKIDFIEGKHLPLI